MSKSNAVSWLESRRGYALWYDTETRHFTVYSLKKLPKRDWKEIGKYRTSVRWSCEISEDLKSFAEVNGMTKKAPATLRTLVTTLMNALNGSQHKYNDSFDSRRKTRHRQRCVVGQRATVGVSVVAFVITLTACSVVQAMVADISSTHLWVAGSAVMVGIIAAALLTWFHLANRKEKSPKPVPFRLFNKQKPEAVQRVVTMFARKHISTIKYDQKNLSSLV